MVPAVYPYNCSPVEIMASQDDFQQTVDRLAGHMGSDDAKAQAAAAVTVCLMMQSPVSQQFVPNADLSNVAGRLCELLDSQDAAVQRNAAAALSACLESSDSAVQAAIENRAAERAVSQLEALAGDNSSGSAAAAAAAAAAAPEGSADVGLQLNLLVLLGTLGEASEATAQLVLDAGGLQQLQAGGDPSAREQLQEAAVDGLCKLVASSGVAKEAAAAAGAIPRLAALLGSGSPGAPAEVQVRALLCLGMLIGGSPERQLELAGVPGAVAALLRLMRQADVDGDCQQIAAGLFKELASNAEAKEALTAALKEQQAADAAVSAKAPL